MRKEEEIVDACIAISVFIIFLLFYFVASNWKSFVSCYLSMVRALLIFSCNLCLVFPHPRLNCTSSLTSDWQICKKNKKSNCQCCRKWSPTRVESYDDLEELLFAAEEGTGGVLIDESRQQDDEITMQNFFCDVLKQNAKRLVENVEQEESREPLLWMRRSYYQQYMLKERLWCRLLIVRKVQ